MPSNQPHIGLHAADVAGFDELLQLAHLDRSTAQRVVDSLEHAARFHLERRPTLGLDEIIFRAPFLTPQVEIVHRGWQELIGTLQNVRLRLGSSGPVSPAIQDDLRDAVEEYGDLLTTEQQLLHEAYEPVE